MSVVDSQIACMDCLKSSPICTLQISASAWVIPDMSAFGTTMLEIAVLARELNSVVGTEIEMPRVRSANRCEETDMSESYFLGSKSIEFATFRPDFTTTREWREGADAQHLG